MLILDGIATGALTGLAISGVGGVILKLNSTGPNSDIPNGILYGTVGGVIGGLVGDIVTVNSPAGIVTGAVVGTGVGLALLIAKDISKIG